MDYLAASVQSIMNTIELNDEQKLERINMLVGKTIEIEKLSIVQSILSEINKKGSKNIEFNQIYPNIKTRAGMVATDRFNNMPAEAQENIEKNIMSIKLDDLKLKDIMASLAGINLVNESKEPEQIDSKSEFPSISLEDNSVKSLKMAVSSSGFDTQISNAIEQYKKGEPVSLTINTGLALKLHSVKCLSKLHRIRSDKISMGCETIDDKNVHEKTAEFQVDNSFNVNDIMSYDEPKTLKLFNLDTSYPKVFSAYILLVEKGNIGVSNFISKFYNAIKDDIPELTKLAGKALGLEIGDIGGLLLGKAAGLALDSLTRWGSEAFKDDMFPMKQVFVTLQSAPKGQLKSPVVKLTFKFHAAEYEVCCSWEVTIPELTQLPTSANQETKINNVQQAETLPRLNQFVIFHVNPLLIKSPVPLPNPYIVGRVCSEDYNFTEVKPELRAEVWFGGFSMIEVTIPMAAIYEWHEFQRCMVTHGLNNN